VTLNDLEWLLFYVKFYLTPVYLAAKRLKPGFRSLYTLKLVVDVGEL